MKTYIILSQKTWNNNLVERLQQQFPEHKFIHISTREDFTQEHLQELNPDKVFIPHWSYIIPENIWGNFECIVFHMTDLPYGRGGSPLQNLIVRGHKETKISALRVEKGLDTGDIYMKKPLSLYGSAEEIYMRASGIIETMIEEIIKTNPKPQKQTGEPVEFKRRKAADSDISGLNDLDSIYDYIRMLDAEGYPKACLTIGDVKYEFSRVQQKADGSLVADVRISKQ
jgi:methionyl-tRNA formyltransferase